MKKKIKYLILAAFLFLIGFGNVSAMEINEADIAPNTYVIGTHMFTEKTAVSTSHIMLAAKTISSDDLADMIIYYKKPRGGWINGATGEELTIPTQFEITHKDLDIVLETPTLSVPAGTPSSGMVTITYEGNYSDSNLLATIDGVELYEKNDNALTLVYESESTFHKEITVDVGESKTFVARVYIYNQENEKIYSNYSNEIVISYQVLTPTLSATHGSGIYGGKSYIYTSIVYEGSYAYEGSMDNIDGVELYEIIDDDYTLIETSTNGRFSEIITEFGKIRTFVARVYALDSEGNKVYSDYSNELVIDNSTLLTPTLSNSYGSAITGGTIYCDGINIVFEGAYAYQGSMDNIDGVELYEIIDDDYTLIETSSDGSFSQITVELGKVRTFVARVYALDSEGNKVYSDYSNELVLDNSYLPTPTLSANGGVGSNGETVSILTGIIAEGSYSFEGSMDNIDGVELYEIIDDDYTLIETSSNGSFSQIDVEFGTSRTFVARVYALDSEGNKVYSDYSNELVLDNSYLPTPTLSTYGGTSEDGITSTATGITAQGAYANEGSMDNIDGVELYEIINDEYTLIETSTNGNFSPIDVEFGTSRTLVTRVYALDNEGNKVYSDYSNELVIDHSNE